MGEMLVNPEWLFASSFVALSLAALFAIVYRNTRTQIARTVARRSNLTEAEFITAMGPDASEAAALFLWHTTLPYLEFHAPGLTPHPEDDLIADLPIDDDVFDMDWPREWARQQGVHQSTLPDWPQDWPVTIRNYGRWLDMVAQQALCQASRS